MTHSACSRHTDFRVDSMLIVAFPGCWIPTLDGEYNAFVLGGQPCTGVLEAVTPAYCARRLESVYCDRARYIRI